MVVMRVLRTRTRQERDIVRLLRGRALLTILRRRDSLIVPNAADALEESIHLLGRCMIEHGLAIYSPGSPCLSDGEAFALDWLALHQRPAISSPTANPGSLHDALRASARALREAGIRLPPCTVAEWPFVQADQGIRRRSNPSRRAGEGISRQIGPQPTGASLKAQAIALVHSREIIPAADFYAIGISRQYLSLLCKLGYIGRAGFGRYRAPIKTSSCTQERPNEGMDGNSSREISR